MAVEWVALGGFDDDSVHASERLELKILPYLGGIAHMRDALDKAITVRRGIPVVGAKGVGKTVALDLAIASFAAHERAKRARDAKYPARRVVLLPTLRSAKYREAILLIGKAISGVVPPDRVSARRRSDDEIREDVITRALTTNVVCIAVAEGEFLTPNAMVALRDVMANAEERDASRVSSGSLSASGIAVLLVGTPALLPDLQRSPEYNQRWIAPVTIPLPTEEVVARVYRDWFSGIEHHASRIGEDAWLAYIRKTVLAEGQAVARLLDTHARLYWRRIVRRAQQAKETADLTDHAPFDAQLFELSLQEARTLRRSGG